LRLSDVIGVPPIAGLVVRFRSPAAGVVASREQKPPFTGFRSADHYRRPMVNRPIGVSRAL